MNYVAITKLTDDNNLKYFIVKLDKKSENIVMIGDITISGSIIAITNDIQEAQIVLNKLK
ncbi:MAG: hypothetical protein RBR68_07335 [Tenuifilaceae bacterium]|nr:hypothetical protein [Tenuifilaceae bacterium]